MLNNDYYIAFISKRGNQFEHYVLFSEKKPTFIKQISLSIYSRVYAYSYTFEKIILLRVVLYL